MPNVFVDNLLTHDWAIYQTPIEWFKETLIEIKKIKNVNWIIKPHPSEKIYKTNITTKNFYKNIVGQSDNIKILDENLNIDKLYRFISTVISFGGSAGYEYTSIGIPVITVADTRYSNFNLTVTPKNKIEYKKILNSLNKPRIVSNDKKFRSGLYWYLIKDLSKIQNDFIPIFDSRSDFNKKEFWKLAQKNLIKSIKKTSPRTFEKNFYIQYKNKNRHSLNFHELSKSLKFSDVKLNDLQND